MQIVVSGSLRMPETTFADSAPVGSFEMAPRPDNLPPEFELGNVEYKLKLPSTISLLRFEHLVTQMKWRLMEGLGEAVYEIGVADDGELKGLPSDDLNASLATLQRMADRVGASMTIIRRRTLPEHAAALPLAATASAATTPCSSDAGDAREICEVLVRRIPAEDQGFIDIRVSLLGDVDAGKSTLLGVLSSGERDNGKGRARLNLFRHPHEILTGRTSSVSSEIIGFDGIGRLVNYAKTRTAEEICAKSTKLLTLTDLCGHERYLRTTVSGLVGHKPDFIMIVISSVQFHDTHASSQQLALARAVGAPIFIVLTKIDLLPSFVQQRQFSSGDHACLRTPPSKPADEVQQSIRRLIESAVGGRRVPLIIENEDDAVSAAVNIQSESIVPVFRVSCKTEENMDLLIKFLNMLPPGRTLREKERLLEVPTVFSVMQWYRLPAVGIVLGGFVEAGIIRPHDELLMGPDKKGKFTPVLVTSVHRYKTSCRMAKAGEAASVAVDGLPLDCALRKGLFLVHRDALSTSEGEIASNCRGGGPSLQPLAVADEISSTVAVTGKCCTSFRAEVQLYRPSTRSSDLVATPVECNRRTGMSTAKTASAIYSPHTTVHVGTHVALHVGNAVQTAVIAEVMGTLKRINSELPTPTPSSGLFGSSSSSDVERTGGALRTSVVVQRQRNTATPSQLPVDRMRKTQSCVINTDCAEDARQDNPSTSPFACVLPAVARQMYNSRPRSSACDDVTAATAVNDADNGEKCIFAAKFSNEDIDSATSSREAFLNTHDGENDNGNSQQSRHFHHTHAEQLLIVFDFLLRPEFVLLNSKLILRQNRETIGVGKVVEFVDVIEPAITNSWPVMHTTRQQATVAAACGDADMLNCEVLRKNADRSPAAFDFRCDLPTGRTADIQSTVSATPPANENLPTQDRHELLTSSRDLGCLVKSNAVNCTIEQQIRRNHQGPSTAAMLFSNDLVGFDSHSPLAQLDFLDDDE